MDASLSESEKRAYVAWLHSPSVSSEGDPQETILAFKIARALGTIPSRTLRVLRGLPGQNEALLRQVEAFVDADPTLTFVHQGERRRISLVESAPIRDDSAKRT